MSKYHEMRTRDKSKRREHVSLLCLTGWQPWYSGIAMGTKTVETRPASFRYSPCGVLGIHAGKRWDDFFSAGELQTPDALECFPLNLLREAFRVRGALIALVRWTETKTYQNQVQWDLDFEKHRCPHHWFEPGKRGLIFLDPRPIIPIPMRGHQGLWRWEGEVEYLEAK